MNLSHCKTLLFSGFTQDFRLVNTMTLFPKTYKSIKTKTGTFL